MDQEIPEGDPPTGCDAFDLVAPHRGLSRRVVKYCVEIRTLSRCYRRHCESASWSMITMTKKRAVNIDPMMNQHAKDAKRHVNAF